MAKSSGKNVLAIVLIAAGSITLAGLGMFATNPNARSVPKDQQKVIQQDPINVDVVPDSQREQVTTLNPKMEGDDLTFDVSKMTPPAGVDPKVYAVNEYLKKLEAVDPNAKATAVTMENGVATINFTKEFQGGFGSMDEKTVIEGVLSVMGFFPDVQAVKFVVDGQSIESLGHIDLTEPQPVIKINEPTN